MIRNPIRLGKGRGLLTLALLLATALVISACAGARAAPSGAVSTTAEMAKTAAAGEPSPNATAQPQAQNPNSRLDCTAIAKANQDFGTSLAQMVNLTPNTDYSAFTDPSSPVYLDFARLRGELNTLATLPDPTDPVELIFGKPSESITYFRQLVDIAESDAKAQGKPFKETNTSGQKVIGIDSPWLKEFSPFALAMDKACPGFTLPTDTPPSNQATNQVGQTAILGDLHVTLDKVATVPGELGNLPSPGNRFVFVSVTIENTGKTTLATNSVAQSYLKDAAGHQYYFEPNAIMLSATHPINGDVAPGTSTSGTIGYQLPTTAGDLIWIVEDNASHRAVFAVKVSDIVAVGTPISAPTDAAMRTSVAATSAALIEMSHSADATDAALTAKPGTPEPTETLQPTDTPEPTNTPSP